MKISVTRGNVHIEVSGVKCSTPDDMRGVAGVVRDLLDQLTREDAAPNRDGLPFGFSVWADTDRVPQEVMDDVACSGSQPDQCARAVVDAP